MRTKNNGLWRDFGPRTRDGLALGATKRRTDFGAVGVVVGSVVEGPVLTGLVTTDDRVSRPFVVPPCMLLRG